MEKFRAFLDDFFIPKFKELSHMFYKYNMDRINVFYKEFGKNPNDNPTVKLFIENDNLLKHVIIIFIFSWNLFFISHIIKMFAIYE